MWLWDAWTAFPLKWKERPISRSWCIRFSARAQLRAILSHHMARDWHIYILLLSGIFNSLKQISHVQHFFAVGVLSTARTPCTKAVFHVHITLARCALNKYLNTTAIVQKNNNIPQIAKPEESSFSIFPHSKVKTSDSTELNTQQACNCTFRFENKPLHICIQVPKWERTASWQNWVLSNLPSYGKRLGIWLSMAAASSWLLRWHSFTIF